MKEILTHCKEVLHENTHELDSTAMRINFMFNEDILFFGLLLHALSIQILKKGSSVHMKKQETSQSNGPQMSQLRTNLINIVRSLIKKIIIEENTAIVYRLNFHLYRYHIKFTDSSTIFKAHTLRDVQFILETENDIREMVSIKTLRGS